MFSLMFTGIIEELGSINNISKRGAVNVLCVTADKVLKDIKIGDSVAVNGVCLTIAKIEDSLFYFEVMPETSKVSNLGNLKIADKVNLERSLKVGDRISGHFVSGHVDCVGLIRRKHFLGGNLCFEVAVPAEFVRYLFPKASVSLDGISLTVVNVRSNTFSVYIITHTLKNTTLSLKGPSDKLNVEFDLLIKRNTLLK